jgi:uncharacterized coiled-coil protein SlyX
MTDRLTEIEIRYTHLERQMEELSSVLFVQQKAINALEQRVRDLETRSPEAGEPMAQEKPPHY